MTALDDMLAKADEVLQAVRDAEDAIHPMQDKAAVIRMSDRAPDLARALKAVAEALDERGRVPGNVELAIIRAAIERRLSRKDEP